MTHTNTNTNTIAKLLIVFMFIFGTLTSCSSGGDSSNGGVGGTNATQGLGGSDFGFAIFSSAITIQLINLSNGLSTEIELDHTVWPSLDEKEWITYSTERDYNDGENDFIFFDSNGKTTFKTPVKKSIRGIPKLSPDRKFIATFWADEANGEYFTEPSLTLFDRNAKVLIRNKDYTDFAWAPDGSMYLAIDKDLYYVDNQFKQVSFIKKLQGTIGGLSVSYDGKRLAFSLPGVANNEFHVWTMDTNGNNLRQLTTSSMNEMDPVWMGNTGKLLIRQGVSYSIQGYHGCPDIYVVDSHAPSTVELSYVESPYKVKVKYKKVDSNSSTLYDACPYSPVAWISGNS